MQSGPFDIIVHTARRASNASAIVASFCFLLLLTACAGTGKPAAETQQIVNPEDSVSDPFEGWNRRVFKFNGMTERYVFGPLGEGYRFVMPDYLERRVSLFLNNLRSPVSIANQLLQADFEGFENELTRTVVNTTIGLGGIYDIATRWDILSENEDFGQTLAVWGVPDGPYVVAPFLGGVVLRDAIGFMVDGFADPVDLFLTGSARKALARSRTGMDFFTTKLNVQDGLRALTKDSLDPYATIRSAYIQQRRASISDGDSSGDFPEFEEFIYEELGDVF